MFAEIQGQGSGSVGGYSSLPRWRREQAGLGSLYHTRFYFLSPASPSPTQESSMGEWVRGSPGLISPHEAVCGSESLSPLCPFTSGHMFYMVIQGFWSLAADECWTAPSAGPKVAYCYPVTHHQNLWTLSRALPAPFPSPLPPLQPQPLSLALAHWSTSIADQRLLSGASDLKDRPGTLGMLESRLDCNSRCSPGWSWTASWLQTSPFLAFFYF